MVERGWNRKKFLLASFNDNCSVTQRAATSKTVLFLLNKNYFFLLDLFPDNNLVYSSKKINRPTHILKGRCTIQPRNDEGYVHCPLQSQVILHLCPFCFHEQPPCFLASLSLCSVRFGTRNLRELKFKFVLKNEQITYLLFQQVV